MLRMNNTDAVSALWLYCVQWTTALMIAAATALAFTLRRIFDLFRTARS
jgi:hypothetical protein